MSKEQTFRSEDGRSASEKLAVNATTLKQMEAASRRQKEFETEHSSCLH
jgi:hypothetical protein